RPVDDLAVRLDECIQLLLQRPDLVGKFAFELLRLSRPDRGEILADIAERREAEANLEIGCRQEPEAEHAEGRNQKARKAGQIALDLRAVARDRIGIGCGVWTGRSDFALEHAKALAF